MIAFLSSLSMLGKAYLFFTVIGSIFYGLKLISLVIGFSNDMADGSYDGFDSHFDNVQSVLENTDSIDVSTDANLEISHDVDIHHDIGTNSETDTNDIEEASNLAYFSVQNIAAFSLLFGFAGLLMLHSTSSEIISLIVAIIAGIIMVFANTKLINAIYKLKSSGNEKKISSLLNIGTVYLTIPANGVGQIEVEVSGRWRVCDAISANHEEIKTGEKIKVVNVDKDGIMSVQKEITE